MRQVDHETRVTTSRPLGHTPRFQDNDTIPVGHSCESRRATANPANPAPIIIQSAVLLPSMLCAGAASGSSSFHAAGPGSTGSLLTLMRLMSQVLVKGVSGRNLAFTARDVVQQFFVDTFIELGFFVLSQKLMDALQCPFIDFD